MKKSSELAFLVACVVLGVIIMALAYKFAPDRSAGKPRPGSGPRGTTPAARTAHETTAPATPR